MFCDFASTEEVRVPRDPNKPDCWPLTNKVLEECSTVDEAVTLFSEYNYREVWKGHIMIGDRFGNSAVIEPLSVIRKKGTYQVAVNFLLSNTDPETSIDERYRLASKSFKESNSISIDLLRRILDDVHMESPIGYANVTLYSYIHDLAAGDVYIYNFHDYNNVVKLNIHEELKKGKHAYLISSLFQAENDAARQYRAATATRMLVEKARQNGVTGEDGAIAFYRTLKNPDGKPVRYDFGEDQLTAAGHALLRGKMVNEAVGLFKLLVEEFPNSANAYDSLGEAYMAAGKKKLAVKNYIKSLELDPDNDNAREMLEKLQQ